MRNIVLVVAILIMSSYRMMLAQQTEKFLFPSAITSGDYLAGRVIVKFLPDVSERVQNKKFISIMHELKADSVFQKFPHSRVPRKPFNEWGMPLVDLSSIYEICFKTDVSLEYLITRLNNTQLFEYACLHYIEHPLYTPNDPGIVNQYYLTKISAYQAWGVCKGDTNKVVGITDTGFEFNHPDLASAVKYNYNDPIDGDDNDNDGYIDNFKGWDMGSWDNNPQYESIGHGIHVSGIAGARADNTFGMAGVGFNGKLLPVKIDNEYGILVASYESIIYAADHGADVINCSWGSFYSGTLYGQDIINYASFNCNALVVAGCGNSNNSTFFYPASYQNVLSVAATDVNDVKWVNSSYGYMVDLSAPGQDIYSSWAGASFTTSSGTSMASPVVAGAASLVSSMYPQLNMLQVAERLRTTTDIIDTLPGNLMYDGLLGTGRLNMYRAVTDTFSPSVRLTAWSFSDSANMKFDSGDTLFINAKALNYLDTSSSALYARIECLTPNVQLLDSIWGIGVLNTLRTDSNYAAPFKVKLLDMLPSTNVVFLIHFIDGYYHSTDYMNVEVNKDYSTLDTNLLTLTVTSHGNFGLNNLIDLTQGEGFRFGNSGNLVSGFGLMCGTDLFHVADNLYSIIVPVDSDFVADNYVLNLDPAPVGDQCLYAQYTDLGSDSAARMNLIVKQWTYAWNTPEDDNFILVNYQIINDSMVGLTAFYAGLFADWDIINPAANRCWYESSMDAVIATNIDSSIFVATALLSPHQTRYYAVDLDGFYSSINLTDGFTESEKYTMMSTNRWMSGTDIQGNDIAAMVATGPHTIAAYDTIDLTFVIVAGYNQEEIQKGLEQANLRFHDPNLNINNNSISKATVFPNPVTDKLFFRFGTADKEYWVTITDLFGRGCYRNKYYSHQGSIDVSAFPDGAYIICFTNDNQTEVHTFTIAR